MVLQLFRPGISQISAFEMPQAIFLIIHQFLQSRQREEESVASRPGQRAKFMIKPILAQYIPLAHMIAQTIGDDCEVVLHDLENP